MANQTDLWKDRKFYEAILNFEESEEAQDYYYQVMDQKTGKVSRDGREETVRDRILKVYALLFCEDTGVRMGMPAGVDDVADTADRESRCRKSSEQEFRASSRKAAAANAKILWMCFMSASD